MNTDTNFEYKVELKRIGSDARKHGNRMVKYTGACSEEQAKTMVMASLPFPEKWEVTRITMRFR